MISAPLIKPKTTIKTAHLPPYNVVVHDDPHHTIPFVLELFKRVLRVDHRRAKELTMQVHKNGKCVAFTGTLEIAELKQEMLTNCGTDTYDTVPVDRPMTVTLERVH